MPYKNNAYKNFIRSARWQRLRASYLRANPLCERCFAKGETTIANEVHHRQKCHDDPVLQVDWSNLEALCQQCHAPLSADDRRGYSKEIDADGYYVDAKHPTNQPPRAHLKFGRDASKIRSSSE